MTFAVGLAQCSPVSGDLAANLAMVADFGARARKRSLDVVVFPEMMLSGTDMARTAGAAIALDDPGIASARKTQPRRRAMRCYWGHSQLVTPFGEVAFTGDGEEEAVCEGEIDAVRRARIPYPSLQMQRVRDLVANIEDIDRERVGPARGSISSAARRIG